MYDSPAGQRPPAYSTLVTTPAPTQYTAPPFSSAPPEPPSKSLDMVEPMRALKSRDMLERRASKRFSTYTMSKLGGSEGAPVRSNSRRAGGSKSSRPQVEAARVGSSPSIQGSLSPSPQLPQLQRSLASLGSLREDDSENGTWVSDPSSGQTLELEPGLLPPAPHRDSTGQTSSTVPIGTQLGAPTVGTLPPPPPQEQQQQQQQPSGTDQRIPNPAGKISVYVQLGRQTKKATLDLTSGLSVAQLQMLFVEKFEYSPGQADFPPIYVRPPGVTVEYELEELDDVQQGTVLSLNVDLLDQVKEYLDSSLDALGREVRELKASVATQAMQGGTQPVPPPTVSIDQIKAVVTEVLRSSSSTPDWTSVPPPPTPVPTSTSVAPPSDCVVPATTRPVNSTGVVVAEDVHRQQVVIQQLRYDMVALSQAHTEAKTQIGKVLTDLRSQNTKLKQLVQEGHTPATRSFLEAGKKQVDTQSQSILTLVEDLQDTVDDLRVDVIQRKIQPPVAILTKLGNNMHVAHTGLDQLDSYLASVRPSWKKAWEKELATIVEEQTFLRHQENLLSDLREDHNEVQSLFTQIQQVLQLRTASRSQATTGGVKLPAYVPPAPDAEHQGLATVMLEVQAQAVDHTRRVQALKQAERAWKVARATKEEENRKFSNQLAEFVAHSQLRSTGGVTQVERIRQERDEATRLAMLLGDGNQTGGAPPVMTGPVDKPKRMLWGQDLQEDVQEQQERAALAALAPFAV